MRFVFLRETAKAIKEILEKQLKEEANCQLQILMRTTSNSENRINQLFSPDAIYSYENGKLTIVDPELGLDIRESFDPTQRRIFCARIIPMAS